MTEEQITDEAMMAFADGMADPDEAARIEAAIARDPALAQRVEMFRQTATRLSSLAAAQRVEVPDALAAKVRALAVEQDREAGGTVVDLAQRREQRQSSWYQLPLAASLFLGLGIAGTYMVMQGDQPGGQPDLMVAGLEQPAVKDALYSLPAGERQEIPGGGEVAVIASFTNADGEFCREIEYDHPNRRTIVSVACHEDTDWDVRLAIAAVPVASTGYAPASSLETLDAYMAATEASAPLDVDAEAAALEQLKR